MKNNDWGFAQKNLQEGKPVVVATIIRQSGSSPRSKGSRMVINGHGEMSGSIGGGQLEEGIKHSFNQIVASGRAQIREFILSETEALHLEMICGGNVTLLIEPFLPTDEVFKKLLQDLEVGQQLELKSWLVSRIPNPDQSLIPQKALIDMKGNVSGHFTPEVRMENGTIAILKMLSEEDSPSIHLPAGNSANELEVGSNHFFIEPIGQKNRVIIVGAGHISQKLAPLCKQVGFFTVVMDHRAEYLTPERFPDADRLVELSDHDQVYTDVRIDDNAYLIIVTSSHASDKKVLAQALQTKATYIGMIGSRRKIDLTFEALQKEGYEKEALNKVHAPIGLSIGAETPEEIAISIVAELIQERKKRR